MYSIGPYNGVIIGLMAVSVIQCIGLIGVVVYRVLIISQSKGRCMFAPFCDVPGTPTCMKSVGGLYGLRYVVLGDVINIFKRKLFLLSF